MARIRRCGRARQQRLQRRVLLAFPLHQRFHRRVILMRVRELMLHEAAVVLVGQREQHANVAHRQHERQHRLESQQAGGAPARRCIARHHRGEQPGYRADREQRVGAGREARALVEQVREGDTGLDGEDIHKRLLGGAGEIQPQPVRQGAQPIAARQLQEWVTGALIVCRSAAQPGILVIGAWHQPGRMLRPVPQARFDQGVE